MPIRPPGECRISSSRRRFRAWHRTRSRLRHHVETSFANPAVTLARSLTDTFSGIRPGDAPGFILAQIAGAAVSTAFFRWLVPIRGVGAEQVAALEAGHTGPDGVPPAILRLAGELRIRVQGATQRHELCLAVLKDRLRRDGIADAAGDADRDADDLLDGPAQVRQAARRHLHGLGDHHGRFVDGGGHVDELHAASKCRRILLCLD